jgi:hypothetical protein
MFDSYGVETNTSTQRNMSCQLFQSLIDSAQPVLVSIGQEKAASDCGLSLLQGKM